MIYFGSLESTKAEEGRGTRDEGRGTRDVPTSDVRRPTSDCRLPTADCRLVQSRLPSCRLPTNADCRLPTTARLPTAVADCRLPILPTADCRLPSRCRPVTTSKNYKCRTADCTAVARCRLPSPTSNFRLPTSKMKWLIPTCDLFPSKSVQLLNLYRRFGKPALYLIVITEKLRTDAFVLQNHVTFLKLPNFVVP